MLSLPLMISSLFNNLISLIGVAFMGRVGETELAAAGVAALIYITLTMIPYGLSVGFQIIIARRAGENNPESIGRIFNNNLIFLMGVAILLYLFLEFLVPIILKPMFSSQAVYEAGMTYLHYRNFEIFFAVFAFTILGFYTSIGNNQIITYSAILMLVVNVFFNYNLVFGKMGFPEMGIAGAGLASLISSTAACGLNFFYLIFSKFRKQFGLFKFSRFDWPLVKAGLNLSGPVVLQHILSTGTWVIFFLMIEKMGPASLAASNVAKEVYMVLGITTWGIANATNSLISNLIGQGRQDEIFVLLRKVIIVALGFSVLFFLFIMIYPQGFIQIFTNDDTIIQLATNPVRIVGVCLIIMAVSSILFRAVTGTGATRYSLLLVFITLIVYMVYVVILIKVLNVNLTVAWTSEIVYWLVLAWLCWKYLKSGRWKEYKV
ncbi:MAG: MATE family efflux transporter [Chitinophagales bacterium]|nr:MATE family efflux transporter [Bacteroidota bacterium]MBK7568392.1 MATE family efflux transporter [Bacteroidota bacterium]MBP8917202.1 MATE family efflux transporter [Chitinophagales bacterium]MBP9221313.1 MATE family efflux transporter [Chitinophagales bacterium]MBP9795629.1 MATE family efflux transporter [Chitinophagales bacterium]